MARRTSRRDRDRTRMARAPSPNRRPVPKVVTIGGPTLALVVVGLAVAWALSPAAPARHLAEARTSLKAGQARREWELRECVHVEGIVKTSPPFLVEIAIQTGKLKEFL